MHSIFLPTQHGPPPPDARSYTIEPSVPFEKWPAYLQEVATTKVDGEKGVGDTIERTIAKFGSPAFREWYAEKAGVWQAQCGCAKWKPIWNSRYRYA